MPSLSRHRVVGQERFGGFRLGRLPDFRKWPAV